MTLDQKHVKITFGDIPSFEEARRLLTSSSPSTLVEYQINSQLFDCPKWGGGGKLLTPGTIFLTPEGYETTRDLWRGISFSFELVTP